MQKDITKYYNQLATNYDDNRFSNSYGKYIHNQETRILKKYLSKGQIQSNADLGCGTGRFLDYAHFGRDISAKMIQISKTKYPNKDIQVADIENLDFKDNSISNALSFHVFMHLQMDQIERILQEVGRIIEKDGLFIFDIPSYKRRKFTHYKTSGWHGANQANVDLIKSISTKDWELVHYHGIAFFPIHRIPIKLRSTFEYLDNILSNSWMKEYSSHLIFILKKR